MGKKILVLGGEMGKKILVLDGEMGEKILVLGGKMSKKILVLGGKLVMSTETWLRKCCEHLVTNCFITHLRKTRRTLMR